MKETQTKEREYLTGIRSEKAEKTRTEELCRALKSIRQAAMANSMVNFGYKFLSLLETIFIDRMEQNEEITARFMNEKEIQTTVVRHLLEQVYNQIRAEEVDTP